VTQKKQPSRKSRPLLTIGWREWLALPDLNVTDIKAKVDTGARTSALHALKIKVFERDDETWVSFKVHPSQDDSKTTIVTEARLLGYRNIRSSNGKTEHRPVILTTLELFGKRWPIELTLTRRSEMGFRMLLGRQAMKGRFVVDVSKSFLAKPPGTADSSSVTL